MPSSSEPRAVAGPSAGAEEDGAQASRSAFETVVKPTESGDDCVEVEADERDAGEASREEPDWSLEELLWARGYSPVAGVDEAGRGALAGPVVAAAVVLPLGPHPYRDSKTLTPERREEMAERVKREALAWGVGVAQPWEIDQVNVLRATHLAAGRALAQIRRTLSPCGLVTDYLWLEEGAEILPVARADCRSFQAAAAGVLAKVTRDALMRELAQLHPGYGFERNKGYGAPAHLDALERLGPCGAHRMSFRPVTRLTVTPA